MFRGRRDRTVVVMKPRLAAILSIAGVLTAGTAAALVNAEVLDGSTGSSSDATVLTSPTVVSATDVDQTSTSTPVPTPESTSVAVETSVVTTPVAPPSDVTPSSDLAASTSSPSTEVATPAPTGPSTPSTAPFSPPAATTQQVYQLGRGGSVTLGIDGDRLSVVEVRPAAGWFVHDANNESASSVRVRVRTDEGAEVRLEASLVLGVVNVHLEQDDD